MSLRSRFIAFAVLIHLLLVAASLLLLNINRFYFIGAEVFILISVAVTVYLYRSFLRPLRLIAAGIESINDKDFNSRFVETGQEELDRLIVTYNRMIDELRSERVRQQEQHCFLERLIAASPSGIVLLDLDERIEMMNAAAQRMLGNKSPDMTGLLVSDFTEPPGSELAGLNAGGSRIVRINGMRTYRCHKSRFVDRGFHRHFILIEELTREILDTQKHAYDKVIRMMSHEINNSVGAINSIMHSSLNYGNQLTPEDRQDFEEALRVAIDRNNGLNEFMANFAEVVRIPPPAVSICDLHELLRSVHVLMSAECERRNIVWQWDLSDSPITVAADVNQMEQVIVNVVKNACESIETDGTIVIRTTTSPTPRLSLIDSGSGISTAERSLLFAPFYSTKKNGQGIGLTLIREILVNHGFGFNLVSKECGAEFWIEFSKSAS